MTQQGTLGLWLLEYERHHGGLRAAAEHYGIDPGYWYRLRQGDKTNPSDEMLGKLGLRVTAVLYERKDSTRGANG